GNAVSRVPDGEIDAVQFPRVRHDVETEIERATPRVFNLGVAQLRIDADHPQTQNLSALADGPGSLWKEGGTAAEQHASVGSEPVVIKIVFRVVDLTIARTQFVGQSFREHFGC